MTSPLQLKNYVFTQFCIRAVPGGKMSVSPTLNVDIGYTKTSQNERQVTLGIRIGSPDNEKFSYEAEVNMDALIEVNPDYKVNDVEQAACVNTISILFSAARESLLSTTSRCVAGPLFLPTLNFRDLSQQAMDLIKPNQTAASPAKA